MTKPTPQQLTERQQFVLDYIQERIEDWGYPPTIREIGEHLGIKSTNGVSDHLKALEKKGFLKREGQKSRTLIPVDFTSGREVSNVNDMIEVPILGKVAAGAPILAYENQTSSVKVDSFFLGTSQKVFALRVTGDSMIDDGIFDGDYIFVKKQNVASRGEIVVALIGDEATVKYYFPEKDHVRFQPANAQMAPILVRAIDFRSTMLLGVVTGVFRRV